MRRTKELIEIFSLEHVSEKYPYEISSGERQRVALARALATDPKVLLLDEPFSSIDVFLKNRAREYIRELLLKLNIASIVVTHDFNDAWALGDKILLLFNGKVAMMEALSEVLNGSKSKDIIRFLGFNVLKLSSNLVTFRPDDVIVAPPTGANYIKLKARILSINVTHCSVTIDLQTEDNQLFKAGVGRGQYYLIPKDRRCIGKVIDVYIPSECLVSHKQLQ